jgi:hypothetical protein
MVWVRCVTEMGVGVDVHGLDYTSAAKRTVFDATAIEHAGCVGANRPGQVRHAGR